MFFSNFSFFAFVFCKKKLYIYTSSGEKMAYQKLKFQDLYISGGLTKKDWPVQPCRQIIGQDRALKALNFGIQLNDDKAHLFCLGPKGVGRTSLTLDIIRQYASHQTSPDDWVYVADFDQPLQPKAFSLKAGQAQIFAKDVEDLIQSFKQNIPKLLESENYQLNLKQIEQNFKDSYQNKLDILSQKINNENVAVIHTPDGLQLNPVMDGQLLKPEMFNALPLNIRAPIMEKMNSARQILLTELKNMPDDTLQKQKQIDELKKQTLTQLVETAFTPLIKKYKNDSVLSFLNQAKEHLIKNITVLPTLNSDNGWDFLRVNVLTSHTPKSGMPVVHMGQFSLNDLIGKIERQQQSGSLFSDHTMIQAGALHQANGGFLVIEAKDILDSKITWRVLKQALFTQKITMQMPNDDKSLMCVRTLQPQQIPLKVRVVLVGDIQLYHKLSEEEDFSALFKIPVCFEEKLPRTKENEKLYAQVLTDFILQNNLKPFSLGAMNLLLGYASRLTQDQKFLTAHFSSVHNLMREANFIATDNTVQECDLITAIQNHDDRTAVAHQNWLNSFNRNLIQLDLNGMKIGQINGLAVTGGNDFSYGHPSKITCTTRLGDGKIEDVEREITMGGNIHSKGVLILGAYLTAKYGQNEPLCLNATLVWEQLYQGIEGDSASSSQLCALISAIAKIPLNQAIAMTGSVNQLGQIQSVGAVNAKIEGFFDACQKIGLNKKQGVIIPESCQQDLMLCPRVCQAVKENLFNIYTVNHIDEALEILTGLKASEIDKKVQKAWHEAFMKNQKQN